LDIPKGDDAEASIVDESDSGDRADQGTRQIVQIVHKSLIKTA
jgi:hypothetical protein